MDGKVRRADGRGEAMREIDKREEERKGEDT